MGLDTRAEQETCASLSKLLSGKRWRGLLAKPGDDGRDDRSSCQDSHKSTVLPKEGRHRLG